MKDYYKNELLKFFDRYAPNAPIKKCLEWAEGYQRLNDSEYFEKCMMAILSETVIGITPNGEIPEKLLDRFAHNRAVLLALKEVQNCHAWTACSPVDNPMQKLIEKYSEKADHES